MQLYSTQFRSEVEDGLEGFIAGQWAGCLAAVKVIAAAFGLDLFEGVYVDVGDRHYNN
jgi:hypothetical protein